MPQPPQTRHSEHADPHEQYNPVPRVMIGLVLALVVWAIGYIVLARPDGMAGLGDQRDPVALAPSEAGAAGAAINASQRPGPAGRVPAVGGRFVGHGHARGAVADRAARHERHH